MSDLYFNKSDLYIWLKQAAPKCMQNLKCPGTLKELNVKNTKMQVIQEDIFAYSHRLSTSQAQSQTLQHKQQKATCGSFEYDPQSFMATRIAKKDHNIHCSLYPFLTTWHAR